MRLSMALPRQTFIRLLYLAMCVCRLSLHALFWPMCVCDRYLGKGCGGVRAPPPPFPNLPRPAISDTVPTSRRGDSDICDMSS